ncbi:holin [Paenibacillus sp. IHBB 10380]|uniref:phage holin family protein n=1 Tax=Paenibacillus sp. IHBB 10380 TaxID=1566358 RepID=UPI0005CFE677|nr:phage holin family protein [Paenibacillus sp. IHBB 10380]AJS61562.1 holin [Paenibacillus sp. IHBB 10380]
MLNGVTGVAGALLAFTFGEWNQLLNVFLVIIIIDYLTGVLASLKEGRGLDSKTGFWGLARKALMFVVILLGHQIDLLLGTDVEMVKSGAIYFYMTNELISITENYGRLGLPLPDKITRVINILKNKEKQGDNDKS